jgi:pimeloyl-ACP methyl ester carboxylesterase/quercetin dioxygenase-like cupin family protein/protein tyrosine phosphatase (PTP) superfamily phosphohydrolase (DUF442 family)
MLESMMRGAVLAVGLSLLATCVVSALAHGVFEQEIDIPCDLAEVAGSLAMPHADPAHAQVESKRACVIMLGGTLSQTRDGGLSRGDAPPRDALRRLAEALALGGYASIRYDKVGFGGSKAKAGWKGRYVDEAELAAAAIRYARQLPDVDQVVVAGESAGAYLACLAAKAGVQADAYVFLGGHCDSGAAIYEYNFGRLVHLVETDQVWRRFAEDAHRYELALGRSYREMFAAAARGESSFVITYGDFSATVDLRRRREELNMPPDQMFRFITAPALALSGQYDLNVPPDHAARIVQVLREAGNHRCTCVMIPGCDHSFQLSPAEEKARLMERYNFESFRNPYLPQVYREVVAWLDQTLGSVSSSGLPAKVETGQVARRAGDYVEQDPATEFTPERLFLAPGIQIVENITDKARTAGVQTLEGEIGPLLLGEGCQAHFIDMPAGMYCGEHPHSTESLIFTVRGRWVLCSAGRRQVMEPGSLFHFAANTPTGYEVPFDQDAFILIFKGQRLTQKEEDFVDYLKGMAARLKKEHAAGFPYLLSDLPGDHPAIRFARQVNPDFAMSPDHRTTSSVASGARPEVQPVGSQRRTGTPMEIGGLENTFRVTDTIYSGSQPETDADFEALSKLGVKVIVSVDGSKPDLQAAHRFGLKYVHLPFGYDGVPTNRVVQLAKVASLERGPIYVHCHHGLHRGPTAVALMCEATQGWSPTQALEWMREAGTAQEYEGLYESARGFHPPTAEELAAVAELPEVSRTSTLVEAMVAMDAHVYRLRQAQKAGWETPPDHPDVSPAHEATMLWELYREIPRALDLAGWPEGFRRQLAEAEDATGKLRALLSETGDREALDIAFKQSTQACTACHRDFRN